MKQASPHPLPLTLSIVAIVLSLYSLYEVTGFNFIMPENEKEEGEELNPEEFQADGEFEEDVFVAIDKYIAKQQAEAQQAAQEAAQAASEPVEVSVDDDPMIGDPDAPVTIIEFSDYECPFCERHFLQTYPQIKANYIDTGKAKLVFRDYPLPSHSNAVGAANAAECIREQGGDGMYFDYHDVLFQNRTNLSPESYKAFAADFDVDQTEFAACVDEIRYQEEIASDFAEGSSYGVRGTPGFFINGVPVSGAQPYAVFEQAIEEALN